MTTTPTIWKPTFFPNIEAPAGNQSLIQTIGLKNGNILTVWQDDTQGPGPGIDIMARIISPTGQVAGAAFQLNAAATAADETGPKIVALPDGGFVMAYGSFDAPNGGFIVVERFDSTGAAVQFGQNVILDTRDSLTAWEITADSAGNYTVVFERETQLAGQFSINVHAVTYDFFTNDAGVEQTHTAQNTSADDDRLAATAPLANGHIVTLSTEPDTGTLGPAINTVEFTVTDTATGNIVRSTQEIAGETGAAYTDALAKDVAVLTGGQIVMAYDRYDFDAFTTGEQHIWSARIRICASEAPGSAVGAEIILGTNHTLHFHPDIRLVALADGGFFAVWNEAGISGQRFAADGAAVGTILHVAGNGTLGRLSLTSDGRILVPFTNSAGEIAQVILDPRESVIHGTALGEALTTQVFATDIFGGGGDDTIHGQAGNDFIHGGTERDDLRGGGGADTLFGEAGIDVLRGGTGDDSYMLADANNGLFGDVKFYDTVSEAAGQGTDTVFVQALDVQQFSPDGYTLTANVENGIVNGTIAFNLTGNGLANRLTGNGAANTFDGGVGVDTVDWSAATGAIALTLSASGGGTTANVAGIGTDTVANVENLIAGSGNDSLTGNAAGNALTGGGGTDTLDGAAGDDQLFGGAGNDGFRASSGFDLFDGGVGTDGVNFGPASSAVVFLDGSGVNGGGANGDTFVGIENLNGSVTGPDFLTGDGAGNRFTGNGGNDRLNGRGGIDQLEGGAGSDRLAGEQGNDVLIGGADADTFVFNLAPAAGGIDRTGDFAHLLDKIEIDASAFGGGLAAGGAVQLVAGANPTAAGISGGVFLYDTDDGFLRFDADAQGAGAAVAFLRLQNLPALTAADFVVVA